MGRIITVTLTSSGKVKVSPKVYQYNHGQILQLEGFDLPETWDLDLANSMKGRSITVHGSGNQAELPDELLLSGSSICCWIAIRNSTQGSTKYEFTIPVSRRAMLPTD